MINVPNQYHSIDPRIQYLISNISIYSSKLLEIGVKKDSGEKIKKVDISNLLSTINECIEKLSEILEIDKKKLQQLNNSVENSVLEKLDSDSITPLVIMINIISSNLLEAENIFHFENSDRIKLSESIIEKLIYISLIIKKVKKCAAI